MSVSTHLKARLQKNKISLTVLVNKTFRAASLGNLKKVSYVNKKIMPVSAMSYWCNHTTNQFGAS